MSRPLPEELLAASPLWTSYDGGTLIVACSGGKDSVALALAAHTLLGDNGFISQFSEPPLLILWHLDHGLRPGSAEDAEFVRQLGNGLGIDVLVETIDLGRQLEESGGNAEELARIERYRRLLELCQSPPGPVHIRRQAIAATAHHLGDQVETILHNIVRGTHLGGLRGIAPVYEDYVHRPWLSLPPEEIQPYLEALGQDWREDESNADTALTRNLLRHEVMPHLLRINPRARENIAKLAKAADDALRLYEQELAGLDVQVSDEERLAGLLPVCGAPAGSYTLHLKTDGWLNPDLLSAYIARILTAQFDELNHDERLAVGRWCNDPAQPLQVRDVSCLLLQQMCLVVAATGRAGPKPSAVNIEGSGELRVGSLTVGVRNAGRDQFENHRIAAMLPLQQIRDWNAVMPHAAITSNDQQSWRCFLPASVKLPLTLRTWREGDRMKLTDGSSKKLGDIFTDAKVPRLFRSVWAVLTDADDEVLWLPALADGRAMKIELPDEPRWLLTLSHRR
jgi:tRNA(Ile)-lysidine synthetase-like protein